MLPRVSVVHMLLKSVTDHQLDERVLGEPFNRPRDDVLSIAQHRDAVGHFKDLIEVVRHEKHGDTRRGHSLD